MARQSKRDAFLGGCGMIYYLCYDKARFEKDYDFQEKGLLSGIRSNRRPIDPSDSQNK